MELIRIKKEKEVSLDDLFNDVDTSSPDVFVTGVNLGNLKYNEFADNDYEKLCIVYADSKLFYYKEQCRNGNVNSTSRTICSKIFIPELEQFLKSKR